MNLKKFNKHQKKIDQIKVEANRIKHELKIAYDYQEKSLAQIKIAAQNITDKQVEFHKIVIDLNKEIDKLKKTFENELSALSNL